ncbi:MAG: hypothetical protein IT435_20650 [Phycisphaerales bacterium]|nr:hypothetical protein [Phycisphaerales bacterium]
MNTTILQPPELDIDRQLGTHIIPRGRLERRVVWNLLAILEQAGFTPHIVHEDEDHAVANAKEAMEWIFNLDDCWVTFLNRKNQKRSLYIVLGNDGYDALSDWGCPHDQSDGWHKTLMAFDGEAYA